MKKNSSEFLAKVDFRRVVQVLVALFLIVAAWQFYEFVQFVRSGSSGVLPYKSQAVEAFLPIAALTSLKVFLSTGYFDTIHPAALIIFITVILTAWIFKRKFCSWVCPVGALSEALGLLGKKISGRNFTIPKWLDQILLGIKYLILIFILTIFLLMPIAGAISFIQMPYYMVTDFKMLDMFVNLKGTIVTVIGCLILLSIPIKSLWCRYLCPYGALQGVVSLLSPVVLTKNTDTCISCSRCNKACPNKVDIVGKGNTVITTECTGCNVCLEVCPQKNTLEYKVFGKFKVKPVMYSLVFCVIFFGVLLAFSFSDHWRSVLTLEQYRYFDSIVSGKQIVGK